MSFSEFPPAQTSHSSITASPKQSPLQSMSALLPKQSPQSSLSLLATCPVSPPEQIPQSSIKASPPGTP